MHNEGKRYNRQNKPSRRLETKSESSSEIREAVENLIREVPELTTDPAAAVLVATLRKAAATCEMYPDLASAQQLIVQIMRNLRAYIPNSEDEATVDPIERALSAV